MQNLEVISATPDHPTTMKNCGIYLNIYTESRFSREGVSMQGTQTSWWDNLVCYARRKAIGRLSEGAVSTGIASNETGSGWSV